MKITANSKALHKAHASFQIGLAPMDGITDFVTRLWFKLGSSPDYCVTPFLRVTKDYPGKTLPESFLPETAIAKELVSPALPQLMAPSKDHFVRVCDQLFEAGVPYVELNCGCPAPTVVGKGSGSGLLLDPEYFLSFISDVSCRIGSERLSVKMRTGFHDDDNFTTMFEGLDSLGLARIVIHGRTRKQKYTGASNWEAINKAAQLAKTPVVGSGDINGLRSFKERVAGDHRLNGVIIGRGALRNPWIFRELRLGQGVRLSIDTLKYSLFCYALMLEAFFGHQKEFVKAAKNGFFAKDLGLDCERWERFASDLNQRFFYSSAPLPDFEVSRRTLGRVKMIWNFLRSSLPDHYNAATVLRSKSLSEFIMAVEGCHASSGFQERLVEIKHRPERDWMYAGEKNPSK